MKKRISALLLAALLVAALIPAVSFAEATVLEVGAEKTYTTLAAAVAAAADGDVIVLDAGTYAMAGTSGKDVTIKAAEDAQVTLTDIGATNMGGSKVVFENVAFSYTNGTYTGLQHSDTLTYNNCTFTGQPFLYANVETFNNCTFTQTSAGAYNVWTYGAKVVNMNNCTLNSAGKCILVYNEGATGTALTMTDCTMTASAPVEGKAAIEIDSSLLKDGDVHEITVDCSTATGFAKGSVSGNELWNVKLSKVVDATTGEINATVTVIEPPVYAGPVMNWVEINAADNGVVKSGPLAASAGATITLYPKAAEGYVLDTVTVLDASGNTVELDGLKFAVPAGGVTVNATFKLAE